MRLPAFAILLLVIFPAVARAAESWADTAGDDESYAASKAICRKAKDVKLSAAVGPAASKCDSTAFLYGIGRPADPVAARSCAAGEMATEDGFTTGGAATLATIYANGSGILRNYDLAIAYACVMDGASAEMDGRVKHLAKLKADGPDKAPFDICDDITSGAMMGFCAARDGAIADAKRDAEIGALTADLAVTAKAAFAKLRKAETAFVKAASDNEVDTGGTARGALAVGSQQEHDDAFAATLKALLAGKLATGEAAREADKRLNAAYGKVMALKDTSGLGTVDKRGIKATELRWLAYRDAFVAFARAAAPGASPEGLAAALTNARIKDLSAFLDT